MKIAKVIDKENKNGNTVKNNKRAIPEEELKAIAKTIRLAESEKTEDLVSEEEYEAADSRKMTDEEIERFQKRYLDFINHHDLGRRKDVAVMDYVRCVAARAIDQCQHPELYPGVFEEEEYLWAYLWAGNELSSLYYMIDLCGLVDDIDRQEYVVLRNTADSMPFQLGDPDDGRI